RDWSSWIKEQPDLYERIIKEAAPNGTRRDRVVSTPTGSPRQGVRGRSRGAKANAAECPKVPEFQVVSVLLFSGGSCRAADNRGPRKGPHEVISLSLTGNRRSGILVPGRYGVATQAGY